MLVLDIGTFVKNYPDVNEGQLLAILTVREDHTKVEAKEEAKEALAKSTSLTKTKSIFSQVSPFNLSCMLLLNSKSYLNATVVDLHYGNRHYH